MGDPGIGTELLAKLVESIVIANENAKETREAILEVRDLLEADVKSRADLIRVVDELAGRIQVISEACDILADIPNGKRIELKDFVRAVSEADRELFPDDDEGEEDDDDGDDPGPSPVAGGGESGRKRI